MIRRNLLLVSIIVLVGGFAYGLISIGSFSNSERSIQSVFADNTINNQTSAGNTDCDTTSSCTTNPSQSAVVAGGDENKLDQHMALQNDRCSGSTTCDLIGNQQASISETFDGVISDDGKNNVNTQESQRNDDSNNNLISQDGSQRNKQCDEKSNCSGEANIQAFVGLISDGDILSLGNDSKNTQTVSKSRSSNDNSMSQMDSQSIKGCPGMDCSNTISNIQSLGSTSSGTLFDTGANNINSQGIIVKDSSNKNVMTNTGTQEIDRCVSTLDSRHQCINKASHISSLRATDGGGTGSEGNNNMDSINLFTSGSSNGNEVADVSEQQSKDCQDSQCTNTIGTGFTIGRQVSLSAVTGGTKNTISQDNLQLDSGKDNKVSNHNIQRNSHCESSSDCDNSLGSSWVIALDIGDAILNDGSNNIHKQTTSQNSVGNTNTVSSSGTQENKNCQDNTGCINIINIGGITGANLDGFVQTSGNDNSIDEKLNIVNSANDNNMKQNAKEENTDCTDTSLCYNELDVDAGVGVVSGGGIRNFGDTNSISTNMDIINSNNNNKISQEGEQSNGHCSESSSCLNFGDVNSNIGSAHGSDISNEDSNSKIVESATIEDTNNGNIISQKLHQNNQCSEGSHCVNSGSLSADISGQNNQEVDQSLNQKNVCVKQSICNSGGNVIGESGSNTQSNLCINNSHCSNSGTNNKNICVNGGSCSNFGTDTKVIGIGDSCLSGVDGSTTICSHGRIISVGQDPDKRK